MNENVYMKNPHLDGESFYWQGNATGILLFHGFTATTTEVRLLANCLKTQGYTISAPLLPGHGTHPADLNKKKWLDWYETADIAYLELLRKCERVFVGGESMGALLALLVASRHINVHGVMLFAPAIKINGLWMADLLKYVKPYKPKIAKDDGLPWKGYNVNPIKALSQLRKLQKITKRELLNVTQPTLIVTGELDKTIAPDSGRIVLDGISSQDKSLRHMLNSGHTILIDQEISQVCELTQTFIENHAEN